MITMSYSGSYGENIRGVKRPYRKQALQTGYSQKGAAVNSTPLPMHTYSTATTQQTEAIRPGVDPHTFERPVRPAVEAIEGGMPIASAFFPWHTVSKPESANLIQRQKVDLSTTTVADGEYIDAVVINVSNNVDGTDSWVGGAPAATAFTGTAPAPRLPAQTGTITSTPGAPSNPTQANRRSATTNPYSSRAAGGTTFAPSVANITSGSNQFIYRVASFGHAESGAAATGITYQIWIDGKLFMEWPDFQWSPTIPQRDQWFFENPLVVEKQIVYRVINSTGGNLTGVAEAIFSGWVENRDYYNDVGYDQLKS
jgi:hypothetical protein